MTGPVTTAWSVHDPANIVFERRRALQVARNLHQRLYGEHPTGLIPESARTGFELALSGALIVEFGEWVGGWNWTSGEGGGGGPVHGWCCGPHSICRKGESSFDATAERIADAVQDWHEFLIELDGHFETIAVACEGQDLAAHVDSAAAHLLPVILIRTEATDAWYHTFSVILNWYLESQQLHDTEISAEIARVCSGVFESWCAPDDTACATACRELGSAVTQAVDAETPAPVVTDTTARWLESRDLNNQRGAPAPAFTAPAREDRHAEFIETHDRPRSRDRADGMQQALLLGRQAAQDKVPLNWELLCKLQAAVLHVPVQFRTTDAYAKNGREWYPLRERTQSDFERCLLDATDRSTPAVHRAALVYMDICFFHPFPDGNGRSARLALDYVLTSAGLALLCAEPLFLLPVGPTPHPYARLHTFTRALQSVCGVKAF